HARHRGRSTRRGRHRRRSCHRCRRLARPMTSEDTPPRIEEVTEVSYRLDEGQPWAFETDSAAEIEAHWQKRLAGNPHLFNGRVLLMRGTEILEAGGSRRLQGTCFSVSFKSFVAWKDF